MPATLRGRVQTALILAITLVAITDQPDGMFAPFNPNVSCG